jgi:hypothetical protein
MKPDLEESSVVDERLVDERLGDERADVTAARRGGDTEQRMDTEADPVTATMDQALYWRKIYSEIVTMEEGVLARIRELMADQSPEARLEAELSNVPVVEAQLARFRQRHGYWDERVIELK